MIRGTRKTLLTLSLGILTTAVLALGSVALIGSRVGSEIERYRGVLISRDDISVVQFDYDSHFWGGELRYRLVWRPERSAGTLAQLLQTLDLPEERRNVAGRIDIRHGPWLGGVSFGLARADLDVAIPAALRQALPQYAGQAPLVTLRGTLGFGGALRASLDMLDYDGRLIDGADGVYLETFGLGARLQANRALDQIELSMDLPLLALDAPGEGGASLEGLRMEGTLRRESGGWTLASEVALELLEVRNDALATAATKDSSAGGVEPLFVMDQLALQATLSQRGAQPLISDSRMTLDSARLSLPAADLQLSLRDYTASSHVGLLDDTVENTTTLRVGALELNQQRLGGLSLDTSLRGISAETYATLGALWSLGTDLDSLDGTLSDALSALAREQVVFSVDRLVLTLPDADDLIATLALTYEGSAQVNVDSIESITDALQVEATLEASIEALERSFASPALSPIQQQILRDLLDTAIAQAYVTIADGRLRSSLQASAEQVWVNGEPLDTDTDLVVAASTLADPATDLVDGPLGSKTLTPATATQCPDFSLSGTALSYTSDALYTPQSLKGFAGGPADIAQCASLPGRGFVTLAPDYTFAFTGNDSGRALEVRLESDCDNVLLINDPGAGWHFDDDSNGNMGGLIRFEAAAEGSYDVWIGSYESAGCNATVTLETF